MWQQLQRKATVIRVVKSTDNDEVVLSYPGPEIEINLSIQSMSDSMLSAQIYGREVSSMLRVFLERNQSLDIDDKVIVDGSVYIVDSIPNDYHRHRSVVIKWLSNLT
jgi:hypothetical protein